MASPAKTAEARTANVARKPKVKRILCQAWEVGKAVDAAIHQAKQHPGQKACRDWAALALQYEEAGKYIRLRGEFVEFLLLNHCKN